jgi:hypothetical protein
MAPIHPFVMMVLYNFTESGLLLRVAQGWKELLIMVLLTKAVHLAFLSHQPPHVTLPDVLVVCYAFVTLAYLFFPSQVEESTLVSIIYGARTDMMFLLPVFLARGLRVTQRQLQVLVWITIVISIVIAAVAAFQVAAPGTANVLFNQIGYTKYAAAQTALGEEAFVVRQRDAGDLRLTRASSLLLGDLALAFYQLFVVPIALALFMLLRGALARVCTNIYLLLMLGTLAVTVTRSAIIAAVVVCAVLVVWRRSIGLASLLSAQVVLVLTGLAVALNLTWDRLRSLFSPNEASSQARIDTFQRGFDVLQHNPLGNGLGTSGTIAQRFTPVGGTTPENWYLQLANEMGVAPTMLFAAVVLSLTVLCFLRSTQVSTPWLKALCLGAGGALLGYSGVGIVLHVWESLTVSMLVCFFAGAALAAPAIERAEAQHRAGGQKGARGT